MKKAIVLAIAMSMPVAATAGEKTAKMDVASVEKNVRVSSQGAEKSNVVFFLMTILMILAALSGGQPNVT